MTKVKTKVGAKAKPFGDKVSGDKVSDDKVSATKCPVPIHRTSKSS